MACPTDLADWPIQLAYPAGLSTGPSNWPLRLAPSTDLFVFHSVRHGLAFSIDADSLMYVIPVDIQSAYNCKNCVTELCHL